MRANHVDELAGAPGSRYHRDGEREREATMSDERWWKMGEATSLARARLDVQLLRARWPDRYRFLVVRRLGYPARADLFLKHRTPLPVDRP